MKMKNILILSIAAASILSTPAFAKELQAKVQKSQAPGIAAPSTRYTEIMKLIETNHYAAADKAIKELLAKNQNDIEALTLRTISHAKNHKLAPAQEELDKLLAKYPNKAGLRYAQGMVYLNRVTSSDVDYIKETRNLINASIREFAAAVRNDGNFYEAYNAMGVATMRLGNVDDAVELFKTALKINPQYAKAYDNLGVVELMNNNLDEAERYFKQSLKFNTHNPTSMYHMGQVETRRGNLSEALTWINHSVHIHPMSSPAWNLQGELYLRQGNEPAAINSFKKAVYVKPENSRPYINLANVYENRADEEFAMEQLKTALAINPNYQEAKMRIADMSLHTRKYDQAIDYYSRLLDDGQYSNRAIVGLANTYYEVSKHVARGDDFTTNKDVYLAYDYVNMALDKTPGDLRLHLAKLKLSRLMHQPMHAKEDLNFILQNAGNNLSDTVLKAEAYLAMGRDKDAVYTFETALTMTDNVDDDLYLAEILVMNKQMRTARIALQRALAKDPDNIIAKNGISYIDLCETKSQEFFHRAIKMHEEKGYAISIEYCNKAIDFYHNNPAIAKLKAVNYEMESNLTEALRYYDQYLYLNPNASDKDAVVNKINNFKTLINRVPNANTSVTTPVQTNINRR